MDVPGNFTSYNTVLTTRSMSDRGDRLAQLEEEAADRERALTDCRLEVLSAQHQLQAQADTIARLQVSVWLRSAVFVADPF